MVREDSFCIFIFYESSKSRFLEEWAELVASQLTQISTYAIKNKIGENQWWRVVFT